MAVDSDQWLTLKDVSRLCHVTVITARTWIANGRLPACRVGPKMIRVRRSDVDALMSPMPTTWLGVTMQSQYDIRRALTVATSPDPTAAPPHGRAEASADQLDGGR
jgi:excisionase family DNA binding protein